MTRFDQFQVKRVGQKRGSLVPMGSVPVKKVLEP